MPPKIAPHLSAGYLYIWEKSKEPQRPTIPFLDYEGEKEKRDATKKAGKKAKAALDSQEIRSSRRSARAYHRHHSCLHAQGMERGPRPRQMG